MPKAKKKPTNAMLAWRELMGYSQRDACEQLGCSRGALAAWEKGQKMPRYIGLACAALAVGMTAYGENAKGKN
jgi:transcriptional regulator with XRE-family HTH domain